MQIAILGGGPAGLYFAILEKLARPTTRIEIHERNRPDDTFGFGVVFSEETLGNLLDADAQTFREIERAFVRWTDIDIFGKGERIVSRGHTFCGLSRKRLLQILQDRARELGVVLQHERETDVASIRSNADLVIAADGVNSATRATFADRFNPSLDARKSRYVWLGTNLEMEAFTFIFEQNVHGLFQVHAYPYEKGYGTFIVECDERTWRAAKLDAASEPETIAYCERLFSKHLRGARLVANRSRWSQFVTVKNDHWHHENIVLIGDAAHTAHFSIGSGTKLAMEDAIALSSALGSPGSVGDQLDRYEADRRTQVERVQRAAQASLEWFEESTRPYKQPDLQFAFSLLTRSRRVTHENLRVRDPELVRRMDDWFTGALDANEATPSTPPMFTSFSLRDMTVPNRVVVSPMCMYSAIDGVPNEFHFTHLTARALGGAGLVMCEMTNVTPEGRITPGCTGLYDDAQTLGWKKIVDWVHANTPSKIGVQLGHAGRKGSVEVPFKTGGPGDVPLEEGNWPLLAPSAIPWSARNQTPRAMTRIDMTAVCDAYVAAARNANRAGFDIIEIHAAHGYLLSSFLSPLSNHRTDEYGGPVENRLRFPLEVLTAVRSAWPSEKPISVRISASDWAAGGLTSEDSVAIARAFHEHGADVIDVSTGQTSTHARPEYGRQWQVPFSDRIRNEVGVPTITVGMISSADDVNTIILAGRADLCALARPHLSDPNWTLHAAETLGYSKLAWPSQYFLGRGQRAR